MPGRTIEQPKSGFALEIDGRLKTEFSTKEGAEHGAIELKRRFPMLQIRIYDAGTRTAATGTSGHVFRISLSRRRTRTHSSTALTNGLGPSSENWQTADRSSASDCSPSRRQF